MAGQIRMDVKGIEPLVKRFQDKETPAKPVRVFYLAAGKVMRTQVQKSVSVRTGKGKRSVRRSGVAKRKMPKLMKVFTRLYYLRFVEFGTQHMLALRQFLEGLQKSQPAIRRGLIKLESDLVHALKGER